MEGAPLTGKVRTWYGLSAEIAIKAGYWHCVTVGSLSLPHLALVNLAVRRGLSDKDRPRLSFWHEEGHLQTLPVIAAYSPWLWRRARAPRRNNSWLLARHLATVLATLAAWEVAAEGYAMLTSANQYYRAHRGRPQYGRVAFWAVMLWLALAPRCSRRSLSLLTRAAITASAP